MLHLYACFLRRLAFSFAIAEARHSFNADGESGVIRSVFGYHGDSNA